MRPSFHPRLVNGPFQDPGLLVSWAFRKRAVLFDLGDPGALSPADLLKTDLVFISHTHMDHFIGFDDLVRLMLGRAKRISLFGPKGILDNVDGKLRGYTWNLVGNYSDSLVLDVIEIRDCRRIHQTFDCRSGFRPGRPTESVLDEDVLYHDAEIRVSAACLEHGIPCLAFSLQERFHINMLKDTMQQMELATGPWISRFKQLLYEKADPRTIIEVPSTRDGAASHRLELASLADRITRITPGQKIAYVVDAASSPSNEEKIIALARNADHLFIEAAFLHRDKAVAQSKNHLTAFQAGTLARDANVKRLTVFHHSPRYEGQGDLLEQEARSAFDRR
jgi:ribonuclease Z